MISSGFSSGSSSGGSSGSIASRCISLLLLPPSQVESAELAEMMKQAQAAAARRKSKEARITLKSPPQKVTRTYTDLEKILGTGPGCVSC